ncbi:hypothetical protein FACS189454_10220 [Planctomycetales bacterium]|nr:hypothetical protein FACS189454_10220 [Planctomycetales bacterium]
MRNFETILIEDKIVSAEQLKQVKNYADAIGIELHEAVLQRKCAAPDVVMMAYAESVRMQFLHVSDIAVDPDIVSRINPNLLRQYSIFPFSLKEDSVQVLASRPILPDAEEQIKAVFNLPVKCFLCSPSELSTAIQQYCAKSGDTGSIPNPAAQRGQKPVGAKTTEKSVSNRPTKHAAPLNEYEIRNRLLYSIMAFAWSVGLTCIILYSLRFPRPLHDTAWQFPVLALCGIIVGGIAARITWAKMSVHRED